MSRNAMVLTMVGAALVAAGVAGGMWWSQRGMTRTAAETPAKAQEGKKVLYWHDPMTPGQKFDKPGKSPFMDMQLVPVYADEADGGGVSISPRVQQNLGVRIAEATRGEVAPAIEAVGTVVYNERDVAVVQARANGFVEKLHVRAALDPVRRGQPLADLYVPDWVAAQEEYLGVMRMGGAGLGSLREAAAQRMRLAGMPEDHVRSVIATGKVHPRFTLASPIDGVVSELGAREGMTVMSGAPLFRLNGLSPIWVNAEVPEAHAAHVRPGNAVEARAAALPGRTFKGKVSAILPEVNAATRTLKARVELANPGGELVPGMFVTVSFSGPAPRQVVLVPTEAVIPTGRRTVVVLAETGEDGKQRFKPVDVETGSESGGMTEIRKGLEPGMKVVVSGQFLIDSEANLKSSTARFAEGGAPAAKAHTADGKIESIDAHSALLSHGPIPELQWGSMTMEFKVRHGVPVEGIKPGAEVTFEFVDAGGGEYQIIAIRPKAAK